MMLPDEAVAQAEAIAWYLRLRDDAHADWTGFTAWLEACPVNNMAYETVSAADADVASWLADAAPLRSANDNPAVPHANKYVVGGWAVAAMIAAVAGYQAFQHDKTTYAVETRAGEHRAIALSDGTRIDLNGETRLLLRKDDARFAALDRGEAAFTVVHNADHPFTLAIGADYVQDMGTVFNAVRTPYGVRTEVAEGSIIYNPGRQAIRLDAGKVLTISSDGGAAQVANVRPDAVASWRHDKLIYDQAPLSKVADDLSRNLGTQVLVEPNIASRPFSGVIKLGDGRAAFFEKLAGLLDVKATRDGNGWRLASRISASR